MVIHDVTTPEQALANLDLTELVSARRLNALNIVEDQLARRFDGHKFSIQYAPRPLGGSEAWLDETMVAFVRMTYEDAGWRVSDDGVSLQFEISPRCRVCPSPGQTETEGEDK